MSTPIEGGQRIVVIGAGIVGATAALVLRRQGHAVTLVDENEPGSGCSFGNGGAISPDFCVPIALPGMLRNVPGWLMDRHGPLVVRWGYFPRALPWLIRWIRAGNLENVKALSLALHALHAPSLRRYDELLGTHARGLIETTGQVYAWRGQHIGSTEALATQLRDERGVRSQPLSQAQLRAMDPCLAPHFTRGLFFPDNGHTLNPQRLVQTLVLLFTQAGGRVERRRVLSIERQGSGMQKRAIGVVCQAQRIACDAVVVATGMQSTEFARDLGDRVPLQAERGYHVMLPDPQVGPRIKISNRDQLFGLTPMEHGLRMAGTVEIAAPDAPMDQSRPRAMLEQARLMYPGLNTEGATFWMGCRPSTPDSLPVIDRASRVPNVIYAFGHGHTGLTGAPMTAELVADLLDDGRRPRALSIDRMPYRLDRF